MDTPEHTSTDHSLTFKPDLQGLRAIAILLVLLAHSGLGIAPGGFVGVDVFFVLSGYLITGLLVRELEQNGRMTFIRFYARRLKRLLPALIFMLSVSFSVAIFLLSGVEARKQLASAPFAATWTSNLYFAFTTLDYFDELASRDLFLHTWSLGVEEQFYLIWPAVLLLFFKSGRFLRVQKDNENGFRIILSGLAIVFLSSLSLSLYWDINMPQAAFYLMPSRIWQLSLGAIVHLVFRKYSSGINALVQKYGTLPVYILLSSGLILIVSSSALFRPDLSYLGLWPLVPSFGAALIIAAGHALPKEQYNPLANPILVWIGDRSYSLYLWHWPIFVIGFSIGLKGQALPTLSMILLSMFAAILSFRLIELPFWKGQWSHAKPLRIIWVSLLGMGIVIFVMYDVWRQLPQPGTQTDMSNQWRNDVPVLYHRSCDAWYLHARVEPCVFGEKGASRTVVLLGDSIGAQWFSMIPRIFPEPHWRTIVLTKSACAMVDEDYYYSRIGKIYQVCTDWRNAVLDELDKLKPDVLIMGSAATYEFSETQWIEGSSRVFERVRKAAATVFVIPGTPSLGFDGPGCVSRNLSPKGQIDPAACLAKDRMKHIASATKSLGQATNRFPNVHLLDLNDLICPDGNCNAINEKGIVVFRDSQHLTDTFVQAQIPLVRERLMRINKELDLLVSDAQQ